MANKKKEITIKAFVVENKSLVQSENGLFDLLKQKLETSNVLFRKKETESNIRKEEDYLFSYDINDKSLFGYMIRFMDAENIPQFSPEKLSEKKISLEELIEANQEGSKSFKDLYYFLLNNNHIIIYFVGRMNISRFQDYVNWFLNTNNEQVKFEFTPKVADIENLRLGDIKRIDINDAMINLPKNQDEIVHKNLSVSQSLIERFFNDVKTFEQIKENNIISAKLSLLFKKPKKMSNDEYQNSMGSLLKAMGNEDDITVLTKNKERIKGSKFFRSKQITIEIIKPNVLCESTLFDEMNNFLKEL